MHLGFCKQTQEHHFMSTQVKLSWQSNIANVKMSLNKHLAGCSLHMKCVQVPGHLIKTLLYHFVPDMMQKLVVTDAKCQITKLV